MTMTFLLLLTPKAVAFLTLSAHLRVGVGLRLLVREAEAHDQVGGAGVPVGLVVGRQRLQHARVAKGGHDQLLQVESVK